MCVENANLTELREALLAGRTTATALAQAYLARIAAYDRSGPNLNAVRELNPDALAIAQNSMTASRTRACRWRASRS